MDIDGDGQRDILSGSYSRMEDAMAGLFQVLYGKPDGTFRKAEVLNGADGEPLIIPVEKQQWTENICTRPFAVDWDGDEKLDLVVGNFVGSFYWFKGEGKGKFRPTPEAIKVGTQPLKIETYHSDPFVVDWDGDGDLDLLSGSAHGGVQWAENTAGPGKLPRLKSFQMLIKPGRSINFGEIVREKDLSGPTSSLRIWAADVNCDGKLDVLVGDSVPLISPAKGLSEEEFKQEFAQWQEAFQAANKAFAETTDESKRAKAQAEITKVYNQRSEFMNEDRTGFVWLYLR